MKKTDSRPVEFSCHSPKAQAGFAAGTFDDWRPEATPLRRETGGHRRITLPLQRGHHEFKFIVDGQGCCELGCERLPQMLRERVRHDGPSAGGLIAGQGSEPP